MHKVSDSSIVFFSQSNGLFFSFSTNFISFKSNGWFLSNLNLNENTLWQKNRAKYCRKSYISYKIILFLLISCASYIAIETLLIITTLTCWYNVLCNKSIQISVIVDFYFYRCRVIPRSE